jgi:hypothetical protein
MSSVRFFSKLAALAFSASVPFAASGATIDPFGRDWSFLGVQDGLTWNSIAANCDPISGVCANNSIWASSSEVQSLFSAVDPKVIFAQQFFPGNPSGGYCSYVTGGSCSTPRDPTWAALFSGFVRDSYYDYTETFRGVTVITNISAGFGQVGGQPVDRSCNALSPDYYCGAYFYRNVPVPSTAALLGLGLVGFAVSRRKQA